MIKSEKEGVTLEAVEELPVQVPVLLPQKFELVIVQVLGQLVIELISQIVGALLKLTKFLVGTLEVEDAKDRGLLALELGHVAKLVASETEH
jgi:hypothetical protein